jgi:hypothetical protein
MNNVFIECLCIPKCSTMHNRAYNFVLCDQWMLRICKKIIFNKLFEKKKIYEIVNKEIWGHDDQSISSHVNFFSNRTWLVTMAFFFILIIAHLWLTWYKANASFKICDYYFQFQIIYAWPKHTSSPSKIIISFVICEGSLITFKKHLQSLMNICSPTMMVIGSKWCKIPQCKWYIDSNHC